MSNNNDIHVVEEMVSDVQKIDDASQFVKSADPNRIYYSAEKQQLSMRGQIRYIHLLEGIFGQLIPTIQQWIH